MSRLQGQKDAIYGFSAENPRSESTIAGVLKNAITLNAGAPEVSVSNLTIFYNSENRVLEIGEIPENKRDTADNTNIISSGYCVSQEMESLKLKLHGENYFSSDQIEVRKRSTMEN